MKSRVSIVVADITTLAVDAVVNAANEHLLRGAGVCGAIFRAAGPRLDAACEDVAPCPTGQVRITPGFDAKARWIVHAVGPVWHGGTSGEATLLASAYTNALSVARDASARSIAFPAISTGIYGYPREQAARVATEAVSQWCARSAAPENVIFCCFSASDADVYRRILDGA